MSRTSSLFSSSPATTHSLSSLASLGTVCQGQQFGGTQVDLSLWSPSWIDWVSLQTLGWADQLPRNCPKSDFSLESLVLPWTLVVAA